MQKLYDKFESSWITHGEEMSSREVTGRALSPRSFQKHLSYLWLGGNRIHQWPIVRSVQYGLRRSNFQCSLMALFAKGHLFAL